MKVKFRTNVAEYVGEMVKKNSKTVWVRFEYEKPVSEGSENFFKTFVTTIKRNIKKHNVEFLGENDGL